MFEDSLPLGIHQALPLTMSNITPVGIETVDLTHCVDRFSASSLHAIVDSPSIDASLKDGYAVMSRDVEGASSSRPIPLKVTGLSAAGGEEELDIVSGTAVRVLTGGKIPNKADAVIPDEFTRHSQNQSWIEALSSAEPGRNILPKGVDVRVGQLIAQPGQVLAPALVGFLAAAGHSRVAVYQKPKVTIVATGDEVVIPGLPLPKGKLYASNLAILDAWCIRYNLTSRILVVRDDPEQIFAELDRAASESDAVITSGGAWTGDRDMVVDTLERLGWEQVFHRIRIGPGKAVGFGLLRHKPVFVLPGGPPSNLTAFLQITLPGLHKLAGSSDPGLPSMAVGLAENVHGRSIDWTQYIFGRIEHQETEVLFRPLRAASRLQSMAHAQAVVAIPEGRTVIEKGQRVMAQWLV
ncbi:MAG: molybdopterin molybdotransferase MoeA [Desulfovermiculus sp.]|nr:molybdopterin molybdotransferase MoeA [Desulfovermiculus sp.]